jgi:hypothetical protein
MSTTMPFILVTMLCVVSAICAVRFCIRVIVSMVDCISSACLSMSAIRSCRYFWFICWVVPCMLIWNGIDVCSIGLPSGLVIACTLATPGTRKMAFEILSITRKSAELRRSWSLEIIISSGFIRAWSKCRSAAAYPSLAGRSAGR